MRAVCETFLTSERERERDILNTDTERAKDKNSVGVGGEGFDLVSIHIAYLYQFPASLVWCIGGGGDS